MICPVVMLLSVVLVSANCEYPEVEKPSNLICDLLGNKYLLCRQVSAFP